MKIEYRQIGGLDVEVTKKGTLKNLYVRVHPPDGKVTVSAPLKTTDSYIANYILQRLPEIMMVQSRMQGQVRQSKREYISGEAYYLWGKPYKLQVVYYGDRYHVEKRPNKIILNAPENASAEKRERAITEWYRSEIKRVLPRIVQECSERVGVAADEVHVKNMRTRWGTCTVEKKRIWINLQLVKKPVECLEYVVTHELIHLLEKNHTHRFFALLEQNCPHWRDAKKRLSELPLDYFDRNETDNDHEQ